MGGVCVLTGERLCHMLGIEEGSKDCGTLFVEYGLWVHVVSI